jgi:hypothetical protein
MGYMTLQAAAEAAPAGGAELAQVVIATLGAGIASALLAWVGLGHRSGRLAWPGRLAAFAERNSGLPGWATLPSVVGTISLLTAGLGMYWDIALHIDNGRDPGPLANPSHYLILGGLFGILAAGWLAIVLPGRGERPGPVALRIARDWHAPLGGVILIACGSFSLIGFPLDDVSHRLFGQDVTLWGPTHLMLLGGAAFSLIGLLVLLAEGKLSWKGEWNDLSAFAKRVRTFRLVSAYGGLLIGLSIFQGEFDFGVPQFRLLFQPVLIALAAGLALTAARAHVGAGGALGTVAFFLAVRGAWTVFVDPIAGETTPHFPLYIGAALIVEALGAAYAKRWRPLVFGVVCGIAIGTLGTLAEYGWTHVWMMHPWPAHLLGEAMLLSVVTGVVGGLLGGFLVECLTLRSGAARGWPVAAGALVALIAVLVYLLPTKAPENATARVELGPDGRATVRFDPPHVAEEADWLTTIAWQGQTRLQVGRLEEVAPGVWRSERALPTTGSWKTMIRVHKGSELSLVPVYLPADPAIPAEAVPAGASFERPLTEDKLVLQREKKEDAPTWLWLVAGAVVLACWLGLIGIIGWSLVRLSRAQPSAPERPAATRFTRERETIAV